MTGPSSPRFRPPPGSTGAGWWPKPTTAVRRSGLLRLLSSRTARTTTRGRTGATTAAHPPIIVVASLSGPLRRRQWAVSEYGLWEGELEFTERALASNTWLGVDPAHPCAPAQACWATTCATTRCGTTATLCSRAAGRARCARRLLHPATDAHPPARSDGPFPCLTRYCMTAGVAGRGAARGGVRLAPPDRRHAQRVGSLLYSRVRPRPAFATRASINASSLSTDAPPFPLPALCSSTAKPNFRSWSPPSAPLLGGRRPTRLCSPLLWPTSSPPAVVLATGRRGRKRVRCVA